jgi:hypothetical protein
MGILDGNLGVFQPEPPAKRIAKRLINNTRQLYSQMTNSFNEGAESFWLGREGATPEQIAVELGVNAREMFELHYKLGELLATINPDTIERGVSVVGNFTYNEDGSVNILLPAE